MKFSGLYTALITPFHPDGAIHWEGLRLLLRFQRQHGVDGVVILGTTGETPTLTSSEKRRLIEVALEELEGHLPVIVGTGHYSTEETVAATREAEVMGADAALIVTPYYNKPTQEGLYRHFQTIAEQVSIPICLYNIPGRSGVSLHPDTVIRLLSCSSIQGIKEASGHLPQIDALIEHTHLLSSHFAVLSGDDSLTLPILSLGGHGVISVVSNLVPSAMKRLVDAALQGDLITAKEWHRRLSPLFRWAFIETNPSPIKAAMQKWELPAGPCRLPLCSLSSHLDAPLGEALSSLLMQDPSLHPFQCASHGFT